MRRFDERRLIDMRFWMFMGIVANIVNQIPNTINPQTPEQYNLNMQYWVVSFFLIVIMILSFKWSIYILNLGSIIYMIRNLFPFFDLEKRKEVMGVNAFHFLCVFQVTSTVLHLQLLNNNLDKSMLIITPITLCIMMVGLTQAIFNVFGENY